MEEKNNELMVFWLNYIVSLWCWRIYIMSYLCVRILIPYPSNVYNYILVERRLQKGSDPIWH